MAIVLQHYPTNHLIYTINLHGTEITVTVTATPSIVKSWLSTMLYRRRHYRYLHRLVVGLGVQWTPNGSKNPPADTLQLCVGRRCLIFQLNHVDRVPAILRRFFLDSRHIFVGFWNHSDRRKLEDSMFGLEMWMNPLDLRYYAETEEDEDLTNASVREIVKKSLGYEVEQSREISTSDWGRERLSEEQVTYACVDAHCAFLIGKNCRVWECAE